MNRIWTTEGRGIRARMLLLLGLVAAGFGTIAAAGFRLMAVDGASWRNLADRQRENRLHVAPKRGSIYDRNGSPLGVSVEVPCVNLNAQELMRGVSDSEQTEVARGAAKLIAEALSLDAAKVESRILKKRPFTRLKRQISTEEAEAVRKLTLGEGVPKVRGLSVDGEGSRYYPRRELAGPLLGFVAPDGEGKDGVEYSLNSELKGQVEQLRGFRDRNGKLLFEDGTGDDRALSGHDIYLSIDQGIQFTAERELALAAKTYEARGGSVVVVAPQTGELLALASWPGYNPNDYRDSDPQERRNRAASDSFEPGSTMKIFTVAAGLANKAIRADERMYCENGRMQVDNVLIRDTHPEEWLTLPQVLAVSSNICAAKIGLSLGGQDLYEALMRFGFGQESGLRVPGETAGVLRPRDRPWVQVETASAAFGQGISVSTLQLAMATAAIANGGELMEPILLKRVESASGQVLREAQRQVRRRAVPESVARVVGEMMVAVTEGEGTGTGAALAGFQVAGKTATAQKADPATGEYSLDKYVASFVGFVPAKDPVVAIAVTIDEPMIAHAGGEVAAPIFRKVAEMALKYRGLTPSGAKRVDVRELAHVADPANATYALLRQAEGRGSSVHELAEPSAVARGQIRIPDMVGWPARRAIKKLSELGLESKLLGTGVVARQSPAAGAALDKGAVLTLELEPAS